MPKQVIYNVFNITVTIHIIHRIDVRNCDFIKLPTSGYCSRKLVYLALLIFYYI